MLGFKYWWTISVCSHKTLLHVRANARKAGTSGTTGAQLTPKTEHANTKGYLMGVSTGVNGSFKKRFCNLVFHQCKWVSYKAGYHRWFSVKACNATGNPWLCGFRILTRNLLKGMLQLSIILRRKYLELGSNRERFITCM